VPRLAIVISVVGSIESLESTLVSVLENRPADCEIVVALRQPYADPYDLKDEVRFVTPGRRTTVIAALNDALATTRAPFIHVLASGCTVNEGWTESALSRFGDRRVAAVVPWVSDEANARHLFAAGIGYRTRGQRYRIGQGAQIADFEAPASVIGPGLFAAFYRKAALDLAGGFSRQLGPRQADADLALVFRHAGLTIAIEPRSQISATSEADPPDESLREALNEERLFWRNLVGGSGVRNLLSHAAFASWDVLRSLPRPQTLARLAGRFWAMLELGSHARHRSRLAALSLRAVPPPTSEHTRIDASHERSVHRETDRSRVSARSL